MPRGVRRVQETKKDKFERLSRKRTDEILKKLGILGNLANSQIYEYTDSQVRAIFNSIDEHVRTVKARFGDPRLKKLPPP